MQVHAASQDAFVSFFYVVCCKSLLVLVVFFGTWPLGPACPPRLLGILFVYLLLFACEYVGLQPSAGLSAVTRLQNLPGFHSNLISAIPADHIFSKHAPSFGDSKSSYSVKLF